MALEDIGAAVTGFSTGFGLMNDWERQRLAVERERRLAEQAASQEQFRRLGLTRDIIGEYREDAPAVLQATGLPVPDPGLMGVFQRATTKEQEAADYVMNPSRRGTPVPSLSPKHPLWPEVRAAMAEERKRALAEQQGQDVAQAYEQARGADQQMTVPGDMSTLERTVLSRARLGDRKPLDELLQAQMYGEARRQALQEMGSGAAGRTTTAINAKGQVTQTIRPEVTGAGTETERRARLMTAQEGHEPGTPEYDKAYLENLQIARYLGSSNVNLQAVGVKALQSRLAGTPMTPGQFASDIQAATINSQVAAIRNEMQAAARTDPRAPQPGTAAFAAEVDRRIQGQKEKSAYAYGKGRYEQNLDEMLGTKAPNYLDPKTDQAPSSRMTQREAINRGVVEAAPKYREAIANLQPAKQLANTILDRADRLITADVSKAPGLSGAARTTWDVLMQRGRVEMGRLTGALPEAKSFMDQLEAFAGRISKSFAGEVGVLTDRDITRVVRGFPSPFVNDTKQSAALKRQLITDLINEAEQATRRVVYGGLPGADARSQSRIDEILDRLDGATPGAPSTAPAAKPGGVLRMVIDPKTGRYVPAPQGGR